MRLMVLLLSFASLAFGGEVSASVVDPAGGSIRSALHLIQREPYRHLKFPSNEAGFVHATGVAPGTYFLHVTAPGFRASPAREVVIAESSALNVGPVRLELWGCDAPGMVCFLVTPTTSPVLAQAPPDTRANITLKDGFPQPDFELKLDGNRPMLVPRNGAMLTLPNSSDTECRGHVSSTPLRLEGLGPGYDICLVTKERSTHVFFVSEIEPGATEIQLWVVIRNR